MDAERKQYKQMGPCKAAASGTEMTPDRIIELEHLRSQLEQLQADLSGLSLPEVPDISSLPDGGTAVTSSVNRYGRALKGLHLNIEQLRCTCTGTIRNITDILNAVTALNNIEIWDNVPDIDQIDLYKM